MSIFSLKEKNKKLQQEILKLYCVNEELLQEKDDYKSRCEKASEYINCNKQKTMCAYGDNEDDDFEICLLEEDIYNLLNLLQN